MNEPPNPADAPRNREALDGQFSQNEFEETVIYGESADSSVDVSNHVPPPPPAAEAPPSVGKYQIRGILGKGAFGAVYRGFDPQLDREVAIKVPRLENHDSDFEQRFLAEARQLAKLSHPGIVTVFDVSAADGLCYIVSDYLDGLNLKEWLKGQQLSLIHI